MRRVEVDLASRKGLVWENRNLQADLATAANKINEDNARQRKILQSENSYRGREFLSAFAFNLDTSEEELRQTISESHGKFSQIFYLPRV